MLYIIIAVLGAVMMLSLVREGGWEAGEEEQEEEGGEEEEQDEGREQNQGTDRIN